MLWNSGFERPRFRRRMATKGEKYSMYRTVTEQVPSEEEREDKVSSAVTEQD